jgi:uncharacterized DUF497 family protein
MLTAVSGFDWDKGNTKKCQKHSVTIEEIESVFHGEIRVFPDKSHSQTENRYHAIGKTGAGRFVFLVFTLREADRSVKIRPISARYMHTKEVDYYEKAVADTKK